MNQSVVGNQKWTFHKTVSTRFLDFATLDIWYIEHWYIEHLVVHWTRFLNFGTNTYCGEKVLLFLEKTVTMFLH